MNLEKTVTSTLAALFAVALAAPAIAQQAPARPPVPPVTDDGAITTPSFKLPFTSYASPEAKAAFVDTMRNPLPLSFDIKEMRRLTDLAVQPRLAKAAALYPYTTTRSVMGGVPVDTYVPKAGIAPQNKGRVLINLHGGAFFVGGGGPGGAIESVPIAGVGRIKVVSVDYRMAPEYRFPAGSEDVAAVYRELLKTYRPENIGIFGCSAGGMLAGEAIAWLQKEKLPMPGAVGIFCASTHKFGEGDSAQLWPRMGSVIRITPADKVNNGNFGMESPYHMGTSTQNPLAVPAASKEVLRAFPPTLFLTGTRAPEMSSAAQSHLELTALGRKSQLLLFDGMDHGFFSDPSLPESKTAYELIVRFFAENLGHK